MKNLNVREIDKTNLVGLKKMIVELWLKIKNIEQDIQKFETTDIEIDFTELDVGNALYFNNSILHVNCDNNSIKLNNNNALYVKTDSMTIKNNDILGLHVPIDNETIVYKNGNLQAKTAINVISPIINNNEYIGLKTNENFDIIDSKLSISKDYLINNSNDIINIIKDTVVENTASIPISIEDNNIKLNYNENNLFVNDNKLDVSTNYIINNSNVITKYILIDGTTISYNNASGLFVKNVLIDDETIKYNSENEIFVPYIVQNIYSTSIYKTSTNMFLMGGDNSTIITKFNSTNYENIPTKDSATVFQILNDEDNVYIISDKYIYDYINNSYVFECYQNETIRNSVLINNDLFTFTVSDNELNFIKNNRNQVISTNISNINGYVGIFVNNNTIYSLVISNGNALTLTPININSLPSSINSSIVYQNSNLRSGLNYNASGNNICFPFNNNGSLNLYKYNNSISDYGLISNTESNDIKAAYLYNNSMLVVGNLNVNGTNKSIIIDINDSSSSYSTILGEQPNNGFGGGFVNEYGIFGVPLRENSSSSFSYYYSTWENKSYESYLLPNLVVNGETNLYTINPNVSINVYSSVSNCITNFCEILTIPKWEVPLGNENRILYSTGNDTHTLSYNSLTTSPFRGIICKQLQKDNLFNYNWITSQGLALINTPNSSNASIGNYLRIDGTFNTGITLNEDVGVVVSTDPLGDTINIIRIL